MKIKPIKFFSPQDNSAVQKAEKSKTLPTGYVSATGKLVFPKATLEELVDTTVRFVPVISVG